MSLDDRKRATPQSQDTCLNTDSIGYNSDDCRSTIAKVANGRAALKVDEAARLLGIGRKQAYEAVNRGDIPVFRIGRRFFVGVGTLERLLGVTQ